MAKQTGRRVEVYISLDGTAAPSPVRFFSSVSIDQEVDFTDVTSFDSTTKEYVAGLPDFAGSFDGYADVGGSGSEALYRAAADGIARPTYIYLNKTSPTTDYFYGPMLWTVSLSSGVEGATTLSGSFRAAGAIGRR